MVAGGVHCYVDLSETVAKKACAANVFTQIAHFPPVLWIGATFPLLWWSSQPPTPLLAHRALYLVLSSKVETLGCCTVVHCRDDLGISYIETYRKIFARILKSVKHKHFLQRTVIVLLLPLVLIVRSTFPMLRVKTIQREAAQLLFGWLPSPAPAPASISDQPSLHTKDHSRQQKIILDERKSFSTKENHFEQKKIILNKRKSFWTKENHSQQKKIMLNKKKFSSQNHRSEPLSLSRSLPSLLPTDTLVPWESSPLQSFPSSYPANSPTRKFGITLCSL